MSLIKIEDLFHFEKGVLQSSKCIEGEYDFITASSEWKTNNEYTHNCEALVFAAAASGSLGRTHYVNGKFISSDLCFIITPKDPINYPIDLKFYHIIFNELKNDIVKNTKAGTSKEAIGMKSFGNYCLPYFEINKQIEIKHQFVNMQFSKKNIYNELSNQLSIIKQLRQAFLREAMQGRFEFPKQPLQDGKLETGVSLLEKIKVEKAQLIKEKKLKKEKELPPISEDEIPFEIPEHWTWCRLGEVVNEVADVDHKMPEKKNEGIPYISPKDFFGKNEIDFENAKKISEEDYVQLSRKIKPEKYDIIFPRYGTIGVNRFLEDDIKFLASYSCVTIKTNKNFTVPKFVFYYSISSIAKIEIKKNTVQTTQPNVGIKSRLECRFPLPPLHEQQQIVAKLDELMAFCDGLEESIKASQVLNEKLLQEVLREALQGESKNVSI
jgi:type I restriction enzyme S subunit